MAFYYNGRGRNKTLTLQKTVNGVTTTIGTPYSFLATFTWATVVYPLLSDDDALAQLSTEAYNKRLAAFIEYVKDNVVSTYPEFSSMNLAQGAWVMVPGAVGAVPGE